MIFSGNRFWTGWVSEDCRNFYKGAWKKYPLEKSLHACRDSCHFPKVSFFQAGAKCVKSEPVDHFHFSPIRLPYIITYVVQYWWKIQERCPLFSAMRIFFLALIALFLMTAVTFFDGFSLPSGITGRTLKPGSTPGCALKGCHAGAEKASVTIKAPSFLHVNEVARCTVLVSGVNTGIDISVSDGALAPVSRLLEVNGELTHPSSGPGVYIFDYTAPASRGTQTIYATGLSGGTRDPGILPPTSSSALT